MASPFPGMDPWLELHWRDVHARLIIYIADQLHFLGQNVAAGLLTEEDQQLADGTLDQPPRWYQKGDE